MGPSDTAIPPLRWLWLPSSGCPSLSGRTRDRVSQVPDGSFCARCLLSPRGVPAVLPVDPFPHGAGFILFDGLATPTLVTRLLRVRGTLRLARLPTPASAVRVAPLPLKGRLHGSRPFTMISSFQLTRTAKLRLALSEEHEGHEEDRGKAPRDTSGARGFRNLRGESLAGAGFQRTVREPWRFPGPKTSQPARR